MDSVTEAASKQQIPPCRCAPRRNDNNVEGSNLICTTTIKLNEEQAHARLRLPPPCLKPSRNS